MNQDMGNKNMPLARAALVKPSWNWIDASLINAYTC